MRVLLHLDGVGRTKRDTRVLARVNSLVLLDDGTAAALVRDLVFGAGASALTVSRAAACPHLRLCVSFVAG